MHVCEPDLFPLSKSAKYQPHAATLADAQHNIGDLLGCKKMVFVQPSTYGNDNACLLDALTKVGPANGRGVVVFDPAETTLDQLRKWHEMGVRGVRVNLKSVKKVMTAAEFEQTLMAYADLIRPLETWALQLYVDLAMMQQVEPLMEKLGIKVVIDHFGSPPEGKIQPAGKLSAMDGWDSLMAFMKNDRAYVKVSGAYRFSSDPEFRDLEPLVRELCHVRGGKGLVFASDWPHTRFETIDVSPWIDRCIEWTGTDFEFRESLFRRNAEELWDV